MSFSVLTEPVIPVYMCNGTHTSLGIRDVFLHAHEIRDIEADSPLERYALFRFLEVFAMDMLQMKDSRDRYKLWQTGHFDSGTFDNYIDDCEHDAPRFDLFDKRHPFLQSPYDSKFDSESKIKSIAALFYSMPSGNNHVFFEHRTESVRKVTCAEAFRALCTCYLFAIGDKTGPGNVNGRLPMYCVIIRENLFKTLVLNMLSERESLPVPYGIGTVPWRSDRVLIPREEAASIYLLEGLTWMPRRITLISDNHQTVREVYIQPGLKFSGDGRWKDPHVPYIRGKNAEEYSPLLPQLGRAVWRDAGCFLRDSDGKTFCQPMALRCMDNILDDEDKTEIISVRISGLMTTQSKCEEWCEEELCLPVSMFCDYELANQFRDDMNTIEFVQNVLFKTVRDCVDADTKSKRDKSDDGNKRNKPQEFALQCRQYFLHKTHDYLFGSCMDEICARTPDSKHSMNFCNELKEILRETLSSVLSRSGNDRKNLIKRIEAEKQIWRFFNSSVKRRRKGYDS